MDFINQLSDQQLLAGMAACVITIVLIALLVPGKKAAIQRAKKEAAEDRAEERLMHGH